MTTQKYGKVIKGLGGLYESRVVSDGKTEIYACRAKGNLRRDEEKLLVGDNVVITVDEDTAGGVVISEILPRKNQLIRPPMANLDYLFIAFAAAKPTPVLETVDKLIAIAYHNAIVPVVIITKSDIDTDEAQRLLNIYRLAGVMAFVTSSDSGEGVAELSAYIDKALCDGKTAAFAGASGVGKSTLMNTLFPSFSLATAEISRKIERGRHTTRHVEIFPVGEGEKCGFLADTPGFSLIDFARFDFFSLDDLLSAFPDLSRVAVGCRYADCAHVGESAAECAVGRAVGEGKIAESRLESYRSIYKILKEKNQYK